MITIIPSPGSELFDDPGLGTCGKAMFKPALSSRTTASITNLPSPSNAVLPSLCLADYRFSFGASGDSDFPDSSALMIEANRRHDDDITSSAPPSHRTELTTDTKNTESMHYLSDERSDSDRIMAYRQQGMVEHVIKPEHHLDNYSIMDDEVDDMSSADSDFSWTPSSTTLVYAYIGIIASFALSFIPWWIRLNLHTSIGNRAGGLMYLR